MTLCGRCLTVRVAIRARRLAQMELFQLHHLITLTACGAASTGSGTIAVIFLAVISIVVAFMIYVVRWLRCSAAWYDDVCAHASS